MKDKTNPTTEQPNAISTLLAASGHDPYSIMDILPLLTKATEILLHKKDYDGPDYEEMEQAVKYSKQLLSKAACASGAVDTVAERGCGCKYAKECDGRKDCIADAIIYRNERKSSEGQP